jgi:Ca2+-binding RTX toxin-like protein
MAVIQGTAKDDTLIGDQGNRVQPVALDKMTIQQSVSARVHFDGSDAGFHNTVGMYTYDDAGNITSTKILFGDVSGTGVTGGPSAFDLALKAGQHIGFFVAPNAAGQSDIQGMLKDGGSFHLVNTSDGAPANVNSGQPMQLAFQSSSGQWSNVHTQYWTDLFTTNTKSNVDGVQHANVTTDPVTGQLHVAFEDMKGGGDHTFLDANFTIDIGTTNAVNMAHDTKAGLGSQDVNDVIDGGAGNDKIYGLSGNDHINGDAGNDQIYGGSGNDVLNGGTGNNIVDGGSGNDYIFAGGGNDTITGGSGYDTVDFGNATSGVSVNLNKHTATGFGADTISGVEAVKGSAFNDTLTGDKGSNYLDSGAGNDVLRGGKGADTLVGGTGNDTFVWGKKDIGTGIDTVKDFGNGHDVLDLRALFQGSQKANAGNVKVVDSAEGSHLWAKVGGSFQEVAVLEGVHHTTSGDLLKAGLLLV